MYNQAASSSNTMCNLISQCSPFRLYCRSNNKSRGRWSSFKTEWTLRFLQWACSLISTTRWFNFSSLWTTTWQTMVSLGLIWLKTICQCSTPRETTLPTRLKVWTSQPIRCLWAMVVWNLLRKWRATLHSFQTWTTSRRVTRTPTMAMPSQRGKPMPCPPQYSIMSSYLRRVRTRSRQATPAASGNPHNSRRIRAPANVRK